MSKFPHDEFDDVPPYRQGEVGKHRAPAAPAGAARGSGLKWIGLLAVLALLVGLASYFVLPALQDDSPEAADDAETAEQDGEGDDTGEGEEGGNGDEEDEDGEQEDRFSGTAADAEAPVQVLNHEGPDGLEDEVSAQLEDMEYNVTFVTEWIYGDVETPTIYYPAGDEDHAQDLAQNLGVDNVEEDNNWSSVALVVGPEFAE